MLNMKLNNDDGHIRYVPILTTIGTIIHHVNYLCKIPLYVEVNEC